jgi:beta-glucanase (GH16 family)
VNGGGTERIQTSNLHPLGSPQKQIGFMESLKLERDFQKVKKLYIKLFYNQTIFIGKHLWPAIWMMPARSEYGEWPRSGEIDITEYRGQRPNQILGTLHFGPAWNNKGDVGTGERNFNIDFSKDFHTFGLDWSPSQIQWIVDGSVYHSETLQRNFWNGLYTKNGQPFDKNFFLILNLAVGGNFFGNEGFDPKEADGWAKNTLEVDYVKKWEWR